MHSERVRLIVDCVKEIHDIIHERHHEIAVRYDLTVEQYNLLVELDELQLEVGPTVGQMAKILNNAQNTVSDKVTRLERKGLVRRIPDAEDRRVSRIVVSEAGRDLLNRVYQEADRDFLYNVLTDMNSRTVEELAGALEELTVTLRAVHEGS